MKRLSFILALIIALSGMIGLFATPAYAADYTADYTVNTDGGLATAIANCTDTSKTYYIDVTANITETEALNLPGTSVVIYSSNATAPTITINHEASTGWILPTGAAKLTIENLKFVGPTTGDFIHVVDGNGNDLAEFVCIDCAVDVTAARFVHIKNSANTTYTNSVSDWTIKGSTINTLKAATIQYNNRTPADGDSANVQLALRIEDSTLNGKSNVLYLNVATLDLDVHNSFINQKTSASGSYAINTNRNVNTAEHDLYFTNTEVTILTGNTQGILGNSCGNTNATFDNCGFYGVDAEGNKVGGTRGFMFHGTKANLLNINFYNCDMVLGRADDYGVFYAYTGKSVDGVRSSINVYGGSITSYSSGVGMFRNRANASNDLQGFDINVYNATLTSVVDAPIAFQDTDHPGSFNLYNTTLVNTANAENLTSGEVNIYNADKVGIAAQLPIGATSSDGDTSIRFVVTLTPEQLANLKSVDLEVSLDPTFATSVKKSTGVVYNSVNANGVVVEAKEGSYFALITVDGIPNANFNDRIYVKATAVNTSDVVVAGAACSTSVADLLA